MNATTDSMACCEVEQQRAKAPLIVHMIDELPRDGAEMLLLDLMRLRHPRLRYTVACLVRGGELQPEFERIGVPVTVFGRRRRYDPLLVLRVARWLRRQRAAIVHTHLFTADSYGRVAARLAGVPAVFSTVHNIAPAGAGWLRGVVARVLAASTTAVVGCSDEVANALVERDGFDPTRVRSIPNGIDLLRFGQTGGEGVREEFGLGAERRLIGVVGRLHAQKGHADLLLALAALAPQVRRELSCLIIGTGDLEHSLRARVLELGLEDCVVFTGMRTDVPRLVAALDLFVMPSRWEGLPIALLEAMATSRAVLCTRVGGIPDVVVDGINGMLVEPGEVEALRAGIESLLADPSRAAEMGRRARVTVVDRFDITRTAAAYNELHCEALGQACADAPIRQP